MFEGKQFVYCKPVSEPKAGETAIYRYPTATESLMTTYDENVKTTQDMFLLSVEKYPDFPFLGVRPIEADGTLANKYDFESYKEVEELCASLGSGMVNMKLTEEKAQYLDYKISFVAVYGKNSREWILTDIANSLYGFTTMPIYDTLGEEATDHMFNETELISCFLTACHVKGVADRSRMGNIKHLKYLVVMDAENLTEEIEGFVKDTELEIIKFDDIIENGRANKQPYKEVQQDDVCFFSYTSGTTGTPKGAMITHRNIIAAVAGDLEGLPLKVPNTMIHLSYLPLAHIFERMLCSFVIVNGGQYGIYNGNPAKLKEDLAILRPTFFASVPRLFNKFYDTIVSKVAETGGVKGYIARKAISTKLANEEKYGSDTHWLYDKLVCNKFKAILGGRVEFLLTASAPLGLDVMKYLKVCFCAPFLQGYGQTEGLGGSFVSDKRDITHCKGHTGGPMPHNEFKLVDVPEMKYLSTDKDSQGRPAPRGEVLVRGPGIIPGYYKQPEKTKENIDDDGWLMSGDIGQILPGTNALKVIDRKKNIFKLSQGEYVAPDKLQTYYKTTKGIADMFVYGDSYKSALVAVIVLDTAEVPHIAEETGVDASDMEAFCQDEKVVKCMADRLN